MALRSSEGTAEEIPGGLTQAILAGDCVAFVGAGFSAAVVPTWRSLLLEIADTANITDADQVRQVLKSENPRDMEFVAAAEMLRESLGADGVTESLRTRPANPKPNPIMIRRLKWLRGIPFRAILTTNFDGLLSGEPPGGKAYAAVLRPQEHLWSDERFWGHDAHGARVVKLHGDITAPRPKLVLSRRDYRHRLYSDMSYTSFLRAVLATSTVLYLGYSFSDSYLNEMRSEILALLTYRPADTPVAYAIVNDVPEAEATYFKRHEGIHFLPYPTDGDFSGFDRYLEGIYNATNPQLYLGRLLSGRRVLWVDPQRENNEFGIDYLRGAVNARGEPPSIETAATWHEAARLLADRGQDVDLVVCHWGQGGAIDRNGRPCSVAERLLGEIRRRDLRVPVIVFASGHHANENRIAALKLGALAFVFRWQTLFREIASVFRSGSESG